MGEVAGIDGHGNALFCAVIVLLAACLFITGVAGAPAADPNMSTPDGVNAATDPPAHGLYREGELVVGFEPVPSHNYHAKNSQAMQAHAGIGATLKRDFTPYGLEGIQVVTLPPGLSVERAIRIYESNPHVRFAEPNYLRELLSVPNDPLFSFQWGLRNTGQLIQGQAGTAGADIDAVAAWDLSTGSSQVIVAVVDTGIDYAHPDLAANIWTNAGEVAGNGIDDDGNGYVDDVRGWDFADDDNDPSPTYYHGTHCAGIIGAVGNNGTGVAGVMHHVRLMPVRVFGTNNVFVDSEHLVAAWLYAAENGARVISCSFGGGPYTYSEMEQEAIQGTDALFVISAGNDATNNDVLPKYPASYPVANIISVAATDNRDQLASFSNYGPTSVDLGAPGVNIASTGLDGTYVWASGTSMAAPYVAGVAGLVLAREPGLSIGEVRSRILGSVDPLSSLAGKVATGGRLNAYGALGGNWSTLAASFTATPTTGTAPLDVRFNDTSTGSPTSWSWSFGDGGTSTLRDPVHTYTAAGTYSVTLTVGDAARSSDTRTMTGLVTVTDDTALGNALDAPSIVWGTDAAAPWSVVTTGTHDGVDAARSAVIGHSASSRLSTTFTGPATVSFWWKVSSEYTDATIWDGLVFTVDGSPVDVIAGTQGWTQVQHELPAGPHSLAWTYVKNERNATGSDAGWVDQVAFVGNDPLTVSSVTPTTGAQGETVEVTALAGTGFPSDATVALERPGYPSIPAENVVVVSPSLITCEFVIPATAATGARNVVVRSAGAQAVTLVDAFTITPGVTVPAANFSFTPESPVAGTGVQFTDTSTGPPASWTWSFGDGGTATVQDPVHTFLAPGTYAVNLTVTNTAGANSTTRTVTVRGLAAPVANFTANVTSGTAPLDVLFTDTSTGDAITGRAWDFNDDGTVDSTERNPVHAYTDAGTYTVNLTVTNAGGTDSEAKTGYVTVTAAPAVITIFGQASPPNDLDEDGLYEDLNGNGRVDFNDVQVFFQQMDWIAASEPVASFDFNHNAEIDFNDIQVLFRSI